MYALFQNVLLFSLSYFFLRHKIQYSPRIWCRRCQEISFVYLEKFVLKNNYVRCTSRALFYLHVQTFFSPSAGLSGSLSKARKAKLLLSHLLRKKNKFAAAAVAEMSSISAALIFPTCTCAINFRIIQKKNLSTRVNAFQSWKRTVVAVVVDVEGFF